MEKVYKDVSVKVEVVSLRDQQELLSMLVTGKGKKYIFLSTLLTSHCPLFYYGNKTSFCFFLHSGQEKMLRDVPYTLISDLSLYLNPGDRWKQLGGQLNFNSTQINNFALDKSNASQAMLQEWGQKDGATVGALQIIFRKMKWTKEERMVGKYL